jgi:hypothetical protein
MDYSSYYPPAGHSFTYPELHTTNLYPGQDEHGNPITASTDLSSISNIALLTISQNPFAASATQFNTFGDEPVFHLGQNGFTAQDALGQPQGMVGPSFPDHRPSLATKRVFSSEDSSGPGPTDNAPTAADFEQADRESSEEKESLTPAQSRRKAQNRAA